MDYTVTRSGPNAFPVFEKENDGVGAVRNDIFLAFRMPSFILFAMLGAHMIIRGAQEAFPNADNVLAVKAAFATARHALRRWKA